MRDVSSYDTIVSEIDVGALSASLGSWRKRRRLCGIISARIGFLIEGLFCVCVCLCVCSVSVV